MIGERQTYWLAGCALLVLVSLAFDLEGYPLLDPDEGRNAEVAREMAASNDYVLPRLNGLPYLDKPVLFFAAQAAAMEFLGPTPVAARLPALAFTIATLALVAWFGERLFGRTAGWTAAITTAATPFTLAYGRTAIFDSTLTFFVVLALVGFYMATEERKDGAWWRSLAWFAMALGVLTKGPIGLALPLMVAIPYALWRRAGRALIDPLSVLLFVALLLPWIVAMSNAVPGFLRYALVTETALRFATTELGRSGPLWYFIVMLPAAALPWSVVALTAASKVLRPPMDRRIVFLLLWIAVPLLFFTLSQSKRPQYVLPLVPAIGLLVCAWWHGARDRLPGVRAGAVTLVGLGALLVVGHRIIAGLVAASASVASTIPQTAMLLGITCIVAGALAWIATRRELVLLSMTLPVVVIPLVSRDLMDAIGRERSSLEMARSLTHAMPPDTRVVGVRAYPLSLAFYLRQTLELSSADASELTSNYLVRHVDQWRNAPGSTLRPAHWWREALTSCVRPTVFVVRSTDGEARAILDVQVSLLIDSGKYAAYGPCGVAELALAAP